MGAIVCLIPRCVLRHRCAFDGLLALLGQFGKGRAYQAKERRDLRLFWEQDCWSPIETGKLGAPLTVEAIMEYKTVEQIGRVAEVHVEQPLMSRSERLQRWAELLERQPDRRLNTLFETEHQSQTMRETMRHVETPISVAVADPILRTAGLANDTYGEAKRFFDISDRELHNILCYCHYGATLSAVTAARSVRAILA